MSISGANPQHKELDRVYMTLLREHRIKLVELIRQLGDLTDADASNGEAFKCAWEAWAPAIYHICTGKWANGSAQFSVCSKDVKIAEATVEDIEVVHPWAL